MFRWLRRALSILLLLVVSAAPAMAQANPPLVLAAASLQESLNAAANAWAARKHPRPVLSFAASSTLSRQIGAGAPADIFISADEEWMDTLQRDGRILPGTRASFLGNQIVLIGPAGTGDGIAIRRGFPLAQALGQGRLAMADPDSVPAGKYAKAALAALGVWPSVADKVARAENVRGALALVERGQAPLGIVYATDARASKAVRIVGTFPANSHPPITYPIALLKTATSPDAAAFRQFLLSAQGKAIFRRYGFNPR
jgi:molybdate transport system substrate-binding protein